MYATIVWSDDLLTVHEQTPFRRLSVFISGCSLEAAQAVAGGDSGLDVLTGIAGFVDKSFPRQEDEPGGEPRLLMLDTVREFGLEELHASGATDVAGDLRTGNTHLEAVMDVGQRG